MNRIFQKKRAVPAFVALMAVLLIVSCGMFIDGYNIAQIDENGKEVYYAYAGQNMEFSVNGHWNVTHRTTTVLQATLCSPCLCQKTGISQTMRW